MTEQSTTTNGSESSNALELTRAKIEYHRQMVQILVALGPAEVQ